MKPSKILVIEDDNDLSGVICDFLKNENYQVSQVFDGAKASGEVLTYSPDLIILDIMLPNLEGTQICKKLRETTHAPIIIISAKSSDSDKLLALGVGADDYLIKPFSMIELVARVKSHLRRFTTFSNQKQEETFVFDDIIIDPTYFKVMANNKEISLTAKEFKVLELLVSNPSKVFSKEHIANQVWGYSDYIDDNTIAVYIGRLREKLEKENIHYIKTVWGVGYKWEK